MFPRNSEKKGPMIQICICSFVVHYVSIPWTANATACFFQRENIVSTDSRSMYIPCYCMYYRRKSWNTYSYKRKREQKCSTQPSVPYKNIYCYCYYVWRVFMYLHCSSYVPFYPHVLLV